MSFASDTFTGVQFTELNAHNAAWSKQSGHGDNALLGAGGTYAISGVDGAICVYRHSSAPASADYSVFADIAKINGTGREPSMGVCGRMAAAADTFYFLLYSHGAGNVRLFRRIGGENTQLGSSYTLSLTGTPVNLELRMIGDQIAGYVDGVLRIGPVTDTAITDAGRAGIWLQNMREPSVEDVGSLDNFDAVNDGGPMGPTITDQPDNLSVTEGDPAVFSVAATGTGTLTYQWQEDDGGGFSNIANGGAYSGATTDELTIDPTTSGLDGYDYRCVVTDDDGSTNSAAATLTVTEPPLAIITDELRDENGTLLSEDVIQRVYAIRLSDSALVSVWEDIETEVDGTLILVDEGLTAAGHFIGTVSNSGADAGGKVYTPS